MMIGSAQMEKGETMRLIDADAVLETLKRKYPQWYTGKPKDSWMHYAWLVYHQTVENAPTIDAVPVWHGRWIDRRYGGSKGCSECGYVWTDFGYPNYCPDCGARMDKEE